MSSRLAVLSGRQVVTELTRAGFATVGQKGSHVKLRHSDGRTAVVPLHRELAVGTLRSILRQCQWTTDDLMELL